MTDIKSMTIDELKELMTELGDKPFRAKQIYSWLHEHLITSCPENRGCTDIEAGRNTEISVPSQ